MSLYDWNSVALEQMNPAIARQVIHGVKMTVARLHLRRGAVVAPHHHENEQITLLQSGRLCFQVDGREQILEAGQALEIPPNAPHSVEALEDSVALDLFAPVREDWIRGDDAYLRR